MPNLEPLARRIDHVGVLVRDVEISARYYADVFGLTISADATLDDGSARLVYLEAGDTTLQLIQPLQPGPAADYLDFRGEGLHHVCFAVGNVADALRHLPGEESLDGIYIGGRGCRVSFVAARPNGLIIELTEVEAAQADALSSEGAPQVAGQRASSELDHTRPAAKASQLAGGLEEDGRPMAAGGPSEATHPSVAILGSGVLGGVFGAALAEVGMDPLLVDPSSAVVERIASSGLEIEREGRVRKVRVRATTDPSGYAPADVVLVCVKGHQTAAALKLGADLIGERTTLVTLQNGWGNGELLAEVVPPTRVVVGVTYHGGRLNGPARIVHTHQGVSHLGPFSGQSLEAANRVASILEAAGFEVAVDKDALKFVWQKLVLNAAALPVAALTGLLAERLAGEPMKDLVRELAREATRVGQGQGFDLNEEEQAAEVIDVLQRVGPAKASMLQDTEAGRRTEIESVNGAVVAVADRLGIPVPHNRAMVALVRGWELAHVDSS